MTILHWAVYSGSYNTVRYLLAQGANVNANKTSELMTPLQIAVMGVSAVPNSRKIITKLMQYDADPKIKNVQGEDAFDISKELPIDLRVHDLLVRIF